MDARRTELLLEKLHACVLVQAGVIAESGAGNDRRQRGGVPGGFLTDVQAGERHAERRQAATDVGEPALGQLAVTGLLERVGAQPQRPGKIVRFDIDVVRRREVGVRIERPLDPEPGGAQPFADTAKQFAVRFRRRSNRRPQAGRCGDDRELVAQRIDLPQIETGGDPAREQAGAPRDVRGHVRVAVAVTADPGSESDRCRGQRQALAGRRAQRAIHAAQVTRQRMPEALLEHDQAAADLVEDRRTLTAEVVGSPRAHDLAQQRRLDLLALRHRQVVAVQDAERAGHAVVFLDQRAAGDLGGMRREHQLDPERADGVMEGVRRQATGPQPGKRLVARASLGSGGGIALVRPAAADAVVLLGDVGEMKEVGEGAGDRQRRGHRHARQFVGQPVEVLVRARVCPLRQRAHPLHRLEEIIPFERAKGLPQQLAKTPHVFAQGFVRIVVRVSHVRRFIRSSIIACRAPPGRA